MIPYLKYFPNVTKLNVNQKDSISDEDMKEIIQNCPNIQYLTISEQSNLHHIDVSSFKKLLELKVSSNPSLQRLIGIENLEDAWLIEIFDNPIISDIDKRALIENIYKFANAGVKFNIDSLYMPEFIEYLKQNNLDLSDLLNNLDDMIKFNVKWTEHLKSGVEMGSNEDITFDTDELFVAYKKAQEVVDKYINPSDSKEEKYAILYQWMCENVKYDDDALKSKQRFHFKNGVSSGRAMGTNGSVNALAYGSAVCQGYTKSMQMLLEIAGISSYDVSCNTKLDSEYKRIIINDNSIHADESNHSIIKVNLGGKLYYSDVTWDASRYQKNKEREYFLLSKEDISKDHRLIGEDMAETFPSISKERQNELLAFAQKRIKSVDLEIENRKNRGPSPEEEYEKALIKNEKAKEEYNNICIQIENLMKQNAISPINDYEEKLQTLISNRNLLGKTISIGNSELEYQRKRINSERTVVKSRINRLTGINITPEKGFTVSVTGTPIQSLKDVEMLDSEEKEIISKLEEAMNKNEISKLQFEDYKKFVSDEYDNMRIRASKKNEEQIQQNNISTSREQSSIIPNSESTDEAVIDTEKVEKEFNIDDPSTWTEEDWEAGFEPSSKNYEEIKQEKEFDIDDPSTWTEEDWEAGFEPSSKDYEEKPRLNLDEVSAELNEMAEAIREFERQTILENIQREMEQPETVENIHRGRIM